MRSKLAIAGLVLLGMAAGCAGQRPPGAASTEAEVVRSETIAVGARPASVPSSGDESFTMVALPDTQYYSQRLPAALVSQAQWIARHARELNIQMVLGLGDIVDNGAELPQWHNAMSAINQIKEARVPFFFAIGNHDYNPAFITAGPRARGVSNFNTFVGPAFYQGLPFYGGSMESGSNENFFGTLKAAGRDYLVLVLEFAPRDAALEWAARVVESHPSHDVIVIMHSYLFTDNTRMTRCAQYNKRFYGLSQDNDGEEIWSKFAIKYPNIRMILNGHIPVGGVGRRFDVGLRGNLVNEVLSDYQNEPNAGNGWLRIMTVRPSQNRVEVSTYSPYLQGHPELQTPFNKTDASNRFTLDYENPAEGRFTSGKIRGIVRSNRAADACTGIPGAVVRFPGGTATTDAQGQFTAVIPASAVDANRTYQAVELKVEKAGWQPTSYRATVRDGAMSFEQVLMNPAAR